MKPPAHEDIELQRDVICAYLDKERDGWLAAVAMDVRADGRSADAIAAKMKSMRMIDAMLDELIEIPGVRYEP